MAAKIEKIHIVVLMVIVLYIIFIDKVISQSGLVGFYNGKMLTLLSSIGVFRLLVVSVFWFLNRSRFLLGFYWGSNYIGGIWSYRYRHKDEIRYGIWRVEQDLYGVSITGYGLDAAKAVRSNFRSVSQMFDNYGLYEIIFARINVGDVSEETFSKTTLFIDKHSNSTWSKAPSMMRAYTILYGGSATGASHTDVVLKKESPNVSEQEIVHSIGTSSNG